MKMKKLLAVGLTLGLATGLFAGCGADKSADTKAPEATEATVDENKEEAKNEAPAEKKKISIVLDWTPNTNHTGLFIAKDKGFFDEEGLDVTIEQPPEGSTTQLIGAGGAEFGVSFQDTLAKNFSSATPLPVTAVAAILQHNTSGVISLKEAGITRPKDMDNKRYSTWDDPIELALLKNVVEKDGGDFDTIEKVPYAENVIAQLKDKSKNGSDSAWVFYAWDGISFKVHGLETNYFNFADYGKELDYYTPVLIANNDFLKNDPETAKKALAAIKKGYEYAIDHPDEAIEILMNNAPELDKALATESQNWINGQYIADAKSWGVIDPERWNTFYNWLYENKLIDKEIPENFGFSNDYLPQ